MRVLLVFFLIAIARPCGAELPTTRQLVVEAAAACGEIAVDDDVLSDEMFALSHLASAYLTIGDVTSARTVAQRIFAGADKMLDDSERKVLETTLFLEQVRATGNFTDLPEGLTAAEQQTQRFLVSQILVEQGQLDDALQQIHLMPDGFSKPRIAAQILIKVAAEQASRKNRDAALRTLEKARAAVAEVEDDRAKTQLLLYVAENVVNLSERQPDLGLFDEIERTIQKYERENDEVQHSDSRHWAQLGHLHLVLGKEEKAWQCYRNTVRRLDQYDERFPGGLDSRPEEMSDLCRARAAAYLKSSRKQDALRSLDQAATWLAKQGVTGDPDWKLLDELTKSTTNDRFCKIAVDQYKAGDPNAARATIMQADERFRLRAYRDIAAFEGSQGRTDKAHSFLQEVLAFDNPSRDADFRADIYTTAAVGFANLADRERASEWFGKARKMSESIDNQLHPQLVVVLIDNGFLEMAYEMIDGIEDKPHRAFALAKLAATAAKGNRRKTD